MAQVNLPDGLVQTAVHSDDVAAAADHFVMTFEAQSGRSFISRVDYANFWSSPSFDPRQDMVLVRDLDGRIAAQEFVIARTPYVDMLFVGIVSGDRMGAGIGSALVEWAEARARERLPEAPADARVIIQTFCDPEHEASVALLEDHGHEPARFYRTMTIDFAEPPVVPDLPAGIELRPFSPDQTEAYVRAAVDAFQDHYGYVDRDIGDRVKDFEHGMQHPEFDPTLYWHLYDGDEIVANCWCSNNHAGDHAVGYVQSLGVRRPWRGRGLGKYMLQVAFAGFYRRDMAGAALDVDGDSLTGATRLYESVGMTTAYRNASFEKELRPGVDLARRTLDEA